MTSKKRGAKPTLTARLLSSGVVSDAVEHEGDVYFLLESGAEKFQAEALVVVDALVLHVHVDSKVTEHKDLALDFINRINSQIPFGSFVIDNSNSVVYKIYILNYEVQADLDLYFVLFWAIDMVQTYSKGISAVVSNLVAPEEAAERLHEEFLGAGTSD